jgi:hypothetical protein
VRLQPTGLSGLTEGPAETEKYPVAGHVPAIHVFFVTKSAHKKDVDARVKPAQGEFSECAGTTNKPLEERI